MTKVGFKNFVLVLLLLLPAAAANAQVLSAELGVNGLTCSQCSRSVDMQLRRLPFVKTVQMDLEHTRGTILFHAHSEVDLKAVARAVRNAGFSVRNLRVRIEMKGATPVSDQVFRIGNSLYAIGNSTPAPEGTATFRVLGNDFSATREKYHQRDIKAKAGQTVYPVVVEP